MQEYLTQLASIIRYRNIIHSLSQYYDTGILYTTTGYWLVHPRGGKGGRFREFNSQKIFSKTRFNRKYLGKHHGIGPFANQNPSVMKNSN